MIKTIISDHSRSIEFKCITIVLSYNISTFKKICIYKKYNVIQNDFRSMKTQSIPTAWVPMGCEDIHVFYEAFILTMSRV